MKRTLLTSSVLSRRRFLQASAAVGVGLTAPGLWTTRKALAESLTNKLSDPAAQPKFVNLVPNALDSGFKYVPDAAGEFTVGIGPTTQMTGLVNNGGNPVSTPLFGYGQDGFYTWPGKTFEVVKNAGPNTAFPNKIFVTWENNLFGIGNHLLPVDTSLHWAYSLPGYEGLTINNTGVPIVTHLHGGHSNFEFDGNPEFFYSPGGNVLGPQWANAGYEEVPTFEYDNDVPAGNLWYHDHALGITRLNVYAGMAGFYFVRDAFDPGAFFTNPQSQLFESADDLGLPKHPYELALAIQDRMFKKNGALFYSAFPGDPFYDDFITGEGADLPPKIFPGGGPTALAEFFGDHIVVNGKIWPKADVEPRNYRMRLLNGTDSRFLVIRFRVAASPTATDLVGAGAPLPFYVIGSDQGLASKTSEVDTLVFEPGGRYDVVFDFSQVPDGSRVILENIGGDAPFGGTFGDGLEPEDLFPDRQTDRIMAFDVTLPFDDTVPDVFDPSAVHGQGGRNLNPVNRTRKVALFEGTDEFGRLQPLLGTAEPTMDAAGNMVNGAIAWHSPTTENPGLNDTEIWEIYNATGDAHPIHLHLVNFEILDRREFEADLIEQPVLQHNGEIGTGFRLENIAMVGPKIKGIDGYVENAPKDMVTALPTQREEEHSENEEEHPEGKVCGQVTRIKTTFDKEGRYVWHCHILSHEDHEMMRVLEVG